MSKTPEIKIPDFVVPEAHDYDLIDINFLKKIQGNPLGKTDLEKLKNSISSEGLRELPILSFDPKTERILLGEGNHRVEALRQLGYTHVPVRTERSSISKDTLGSKKFKNPANFLGHDPWMPESTYVPANLPASKFFPEETKNKVILPEEVKNKIISSKKQLTPNEEVKKYLAEKLARAKEMGFDTENVYYHGTDVNTPFNSFKPEERGTFFSKSPNFTEEFSLKNAEFGDPNKYAPRTIPVYLRTKNTFDYENPKHTTKLANYIWDKSHKHIFDYWPDDFEKPDKQKAIENLKSAFKSGDWDEIEQYSKEIKELGFDSYNVKEASKKNIAVFEPKNIRSKFAKFDPAMSESDDIAALTSKGASLENKILNRAFTGAGLYGIGSDIKQGNLVDAAVSAAQMGVPKLGIAGSAFLDLLRPTEMMNKEQAAEDELPNDERIQKFKKLKKLFEEK